MMTIPLRVCVPFDDFIGALGPEEAAEFLGRARARMGFFERLIYG